MSAPILWIAIPFIAGVLILFLLRERYSAWVGGTLSAIPGACTRAANRL